MTDREHDFGEAFDCTAPPNCREKNTSAGMQLSSQTPPVGAMPIDRSVVAAQLVEAACRAHEGDHEAAIAHIAHAVELLRRTPSSGPTSSRVTAMGERQVIAECLLAAQARRLIAQSSTASWSAAVRDAAAGKQQSLVRAMHRKAPCRALEDS